MVEDQQKVQLIASKPYVRKIPAGKFSSVVFFGPINYSFMAVTILDWGSTEGAELELRLGGQGIGSQSNLIQRQNNGLFCFRYSSFYLSDYCSFDTGIPVHLLTISAVTANPFKRLVVWMSMSGTVEGSSLNPNALHSVLQQLRESVQALLEHFHQWRQQEMAGKDLFETTSMEALVMNLSTKSPKKGVRPGKYREKPVQCVRPKCTPRRIILRCRLAILCFFCFKFECHYTLKHNYLVFVYS
ncbi:hypothetical protein ZIOFF_035754 [Zingiber officinale]|uniref:Uncharacterized protein n=1 Tax=Zingiber officinale TaxID=94328 RepID=A0A8J5L836_ZINOF|nr:hypothetical protein ZIOFF_035754 [Zingiber officinale]